MNFGGNVFEQSKPQRFSVCVVTYLTSPYQVEFFNEIAASGDVRLRVIYLRREHDLHPWGRVALRHEHLVLEGHPEIVGLAFRWVLDAALTVCNYYTHWFALAALHLRHLSARPWVFWGERPGFLRLGLIGRLARRILLYPISKSAAPIWAIGRAGVAGYQNDWGEEKSYVNLPYFSDLSRFRNQPRKTHRAERVVLYSGVLNSRKGVISLAQGFRAAASVNPCLRLIVLGAGPLEIQMREILQPVAGQVSWLGFREWHELPAFYARADALCLPTRYDGWAMVVPEALAAGLPVITTMDAGAAMELVRHEFNGWLLSESEAGEIEAALVRLAKLSDEELARISTAARESVKDHTLDEGRGRFVAAAHAAMEAFHCRRTGRHEKEQRLLLTGSYALDGLLSMQRYSDLIESAAKSVLPGKVERMEPPVAFASMRLLPARVRKQLAYLDKYLLFPLQLFLKASFYSWLGLQTIIHVTDQGLGPLVPWLKGFPLVVTVHDLIAVRATMGDIPGVLKAGRFRGGFQRFIRWALQFPSTIVCVSEQTLKDCKRLVGGEHRYHVVLNPLDPEFQAAQSEVKELELPAAFLLHVGNNLWYKNREGVLRIYAALRELMMEEAPALVMMGVPASEAENKLVQKLGISGQVVWLARPQSKWIMAAYDRARALIFPSLQEGFGWPVLEAMARGCPVFASNRAPLTEVGGDAVEYIDPENEKQAAGLIAECLNKGHGWHEKKALQGRLRAKEFSVERFEAQMCEIYGSMPKFLKQ